MNKGYYLIERGWMDSSIFKIQPYTEREAWIYLLEHAAYKADIQEVDGMSIFIGRGQLLGSYRYLAKAWGWKTKNGPAKDRVKRFLSKLGRRGWVTLQTDYIAKRDVGETTITPPYDKRPTIIKINDYNKLQRYHARDLDKAAYNDHENFATRSRQHQDKPKPSQLREKKELSKEHVRARRNDVYLFELFPNVEDSQDFINHIPESWKQAVPLYGDDGEEWLELEASRFWERYAGKDINDRKLRLSNLEKRAYWNRVWDIWCEQKFRQITAV